MSLPCLPQGAAVHLHDNGRCKIAVQAGADPICLLSNGPDEGHGGLTLFTVDGSGAVSIKKEGSLANINDTVSAAAVSHNGALAAIGNLEDKTVQVLSLPDLSPMVTVCRPVTPPRAIAFSPDDSRMLVGALVHWAAVDQTIGIRGPPAHRHPTFHCNPPLTRRAIGSDDPTVRVVSREDPTADPFELKVGSSVKSLSWDPKGRYLAVYTVDGTVHIFDLEDPERPLIRSLANCRVKESDDPVFSSVEYPLAWHPGDGDVIAVGTDTGAHVYARDTWRLLYNLRSPTAVGREQDKFSGSTVVAWSPNGRLLGAADSRRILTVWDMATPAVDAVTGVVKVVHLSSSAGEPAVVLNGYMRPNDGGNDAFVSIDANTGTSVIALDKLNGRPMINSSPRPTGAAWLPDGSGLAVIDSDGDVRVVKLPESVDQAAALQQMGVQPAAADAASAALTSPLPWPLIVTAPPPGAAPVKPPSALTSRLAGGAGAAAAAAASGEASSSSSASAAAAAVMAAAAAPAKRAAAIVEGTKGSSKAKGGRYGEDEAMEGAGSEGEEEDDGAGAGGGGMVDTSLADMKRRFGFEDTEEEGEDGIGGGLRSLDAPLTSGGGSGGLGLDMLTSGRLVTSEQLEHHTLATGRFIREVFGLTSPQAPFQSGSTKYRARPGAVGGRVLRRFLVWNQHGTVVARTEGASTGLGADIDIVFTDKSRMRDVHIQDSAGFSAAALSDSAVFFASRYVPPRGDRELTSVAGDGKPAILRYRGLAGWGSNSSEWQIELPVTNPRTPWHKFPLRSTDAALKVGGGGQPSAAKRRRTENPAAGETSTGLLDGLDGDGAGSESGFVPDDADVPDSEDNDDPSEVELLDTSSAAESPLAVGLGEGWCACVTDRCNLRFFRSGGTQDAVIALPGQPITMASSGSLCAVAYHKAMPTGWTQRIGIDLYVYKGASDGSPAASGSLPRLIRSVDLPLRPHATLTWLGFSSPGGQLMAHDSSGLLLGLQPGMGWVWTPLCDTKAAAAAATGAMNADGSLRKKDVRDSYWPVAVTTVPAAAVTPTASSAGTASSSSSSSSSSAAAPLIGGGNKDVPVVRAVFLKGAATEPLASGAQLPLLNSLPLRMTLVDTGALSSFDDEFVRAELAAMQRGWLTSLGLSHANGASLALTSAMAAASASLRNNEAADPIADALAAIDAAKDSEARDAAEMDKGVVRMINAALEKDRDVRAVQLASRLHLPASYEVAKRLAVHYSKPAVAERIVNLGQVMGVMSPQFNPAMGDVTTAGAWNDVPAADAPHGRGGRQQTSGGGAGAGGGKGAGSSSAAQQQQSGDGDSDIMAPSSSSSQRSSGFGLTGGSSGAAGKGKQGGPRPPSAGSYGGNGGSDYAPAPAEMAPAQSLNPFGRRGAPTAAAAAAPAAAAGSGDVTSSPGKRKRDALNVLDQKSPQPVTRMQAASGSGGGAGPAPTLNRQSSLSIGARGGQR